MNVGDQLLYYVRVLFLALEAKTTSMGWIITSASHENNSTG